MDAGITSEQFELLLPLACQWAAAQEQDICSRGQALSDAQIGDARLVGVAEPERVRLLYVPEIPVPEHPALRAAADTTHLISPFAVGLTLRYGIFIRSDCRFHRAMVVHELGHTPQYEKAWRFRIFFAPVFVPVSHDWLSGRSDGTRGHFTYSAHMWLTRIG
jgi:hypothetical protein